MGFFKKMFSADQPDEQPEKTSYHLGNPDDAISETAKPEDAIPHGGGKPYDVLKQECLEEGKLFEDTQFLPIDKNIFFSKKMPVAVEWKRPSVCIVIKLSILKVF